MKTLNKEDSKYYAAKNKVTIEELLTAIHVFHEVQEEWGISGHCHLVLYSDGSGAVIPDPRFAEKSPLFEFYDLKELVEKSKQLCLKYDVRWE